MSRSSLIAATLFVAACVTFIGLADEESAPASAAAPASAVLGHHIFFSLKEPTAENKTALIAACKKYLSQHPGLVFFAVGTRDENLNGTFNDKDYDVALHMVFTGRDALGVYAQTPEHQKFIVEATPLLNGLRIFDSAVEAVETPGSGS